MTNSPELTLRHRSMFEYSGNIHIHTPYSDGMKWHAEIAEAAIEAGLDFVIISDHNIWVSGIEGYYENEGGRVLLLVGEEIHDPRRTPQVNHFLAIGAEKELSQYAHVPQTLVRETAEAGGLGFIAHPFDPVAPAFNLHSLDWQNWEISGFQGIELWNYMSSFKGLLSTRLNALRAANEPDKYISGPPQEALAKWDELTSTGERYVAIGGSDAHGLTFTMWSITKEIFPYEFLFRTVNTHILVKDELNGDFAHDKALVLDALSEGHCWVGYDLASNTAGFRFSGQGRRKGIMGDVLEVETGITLQVKTPSRCCIKLLRNGGLIKQCISDTNLTYLVDEPGVYRVECTISYKDRDRSWIFSNPLYLR